MAGRNWTRTEDKFVIENYGKLSLEEIAKAINRTPNAVKLRANRVLKVYARKWTEQQIETLKKLYSTTPVKLLKEKIGKSEKAIYGKARLLGLRARLDSTTRIPKLKKAVASYIAGIIDGEGSISIWSKNLIPYVRVTNTNRDLIEWLQKTLNLNNIEIIKHEGEKAHYKDSYEIAINRTADIRALLRQILPYLIVKKKQAQLVIEFCESRLSKPLNSPHSEREYALMRQLRVLNRRGK